jgi:hypothetical protein
MYLRRLGGIRFLRDYRMYQSKLTLVLCRYRGLTLTYSDTFYNHEEIVFRLAVSDTFAHYTGILFRLAEIHSLITNESYSRDILLLRMKPTQSIPSDPFSRYE